MQHIKLFIIPAGTHALVTLSLLLLHTGSGCILIVLIVLGTTEEENKHDVLYSDKALPVEAHRGQSKSPVDDTSF